jgi:hypothetical protein
MIFILMNIKNNYHFYKHILSFPFLELIFRLQIIRFINNTITKYENIFYLELY